MSIYLNEPLVQKLPAFYNFMGGWDFVRSTQGLSKLTSAPRHWRGTKIDVRKSGYLHRQDVPLAVYQDDILIHCNHANQELELTSFNAGMDDEYDRELSVCQKCGDGWDKNGELLMEGNY